MIIRHSIAQHLTICLVTFILLACQELDVIDKNKCNVPDDCLKQYLCRDGRCIKETKPSNDGSTDSGNDGDGDSDSAHPDTNSETDLLPAAETDTSPDGDTDTNTDSEVPSDSGSEVDTGADTDMPSDADIDGNTEVASDTVTQSDAELETDDSEETGADTAIDAGSDTDDNDEPDSSTEFDPCIPNPCLHGGTCSTAGDDFKCSCINGWRDAHCETCGSENTGPEICDAVDNDCDGTTDEGFDLMTDVQNCGGCGNRCAAIGDLWPAFDYQLPSNVSRCLCQSGQCVVDACTGGYGDDLTTTFRDCDVSVIQLAAGTPHTCALLSNGRVFCWGANGENQLGADTGSEKESALPLLVNDLVGVVSIAAGSTHSCAVLADKTVKCWGLNDWSQLGSNTGISKNSLTPLTVGGLSTVKEIGLGKSFSCALLEDGSVSCWGRNNYGQLGRSLIELDHSVDPLPMPTISTAEQLYVGDYHACVILDDKSIKCWGRNHHGQLGVDIGDTSEVPVGVLLPAGAQTLGLGGHHTCALLDNGDTYCFGYNSNNQLGVDKTVVGTDVFSPVKVAYLSDVSTFMLGTYHSCAVLTNGKVSCWGNGDYGRLGTPIENSDSYLPVTVDGISTAVSGSANYWHTCVALSDDVPRCWGRNHRGQLGNGETGVNTNVSPVSVRDLL